MRSVHSKEAGREDSAPKSFAVAMPTPLALRKAVSGTTAMRGRARVAGVPSSGHASHGFPRNPRELPISSCVWEVPPAKGDQRRAWMDGGAVVEPHSTDEGGEPQGSRGERPRYPLEGRGCPSGRLGRGNHLRDSELGLMSPSLARLSALASGRVLERGGESSRRTRCGKSARWGL